MKQEKIKIIFFLLLLFPFLLFAQNTNIEHGPTVDRERGQVNAEPIWRQALGGAITGIPTVQVQSIVAVLDGGNIKAYSSSGRPLWNFSARGRLSPFVTRSREGTSYFSRTNGILIAVNRSGRELWRQNPGDPVSGSIVIGWDGRLFVPTDKKINCYTAAGRQLWKQEFSQHIAISPKIDTSGSLILALENGEMLRIDPFGNTVSRTLPAVPHTLVSLANNQYIALFKNNVIAFIDFSDNEYNVSMSLPGPPLAAVSRGNNTAVCLTDGRLVLISAEGNIMWTGDSHISVIRRSGGQLDTQAHMLFDERGIYLLSPSGASGFTEDGRRLWFTLLENASTIPAFDDDGILYSGGRDWILNAYRLEERSRQVKQSLYGPLPPGNYGMGNPLPSSWADFHFRFDESNLQRELGTIASFIQSGNIGPQENEFCAFLMETASGGYNRQTERALVQYRVRALQLLAQIGSRETIPYLVDIFIRDNDPSVRAAAAAAIGTIGVDPDGEALQAFLRAISPTANPNNEQVLVAVASATGALCRFSGPPLSEAGVKILTLLTTASQPRPVRQQAQRELSSLKM